MHWWTSPDQWSYMCWNLNHMEEEVNAAGWTQGWQPVHLNNRPIKKRDAVCVLCWVINKSVSWAFCSSLDVTFWSRRRTCRRVLLTAEAFTFTSSSSDEVTQVSCCSFRLVVLRIMTLWIKFSTRVSCRTSLQFSPLLRLHAWGKKNDFKVLLTYLKNN